MYLTRMELNTRNMDTIRLLSSQEKIHGMVESGFSRERKRNLWRLESLGDRLYLLILSSDRPDLSSGVRRYLLLSGTDFFAALKRHLFLQRF